MQLSTGGCKVAAPVFLPVLGPNGCPTDVFQDCLSHCRFSSSSIRWTASYLPQASLSSHKCTEIKSWAFGMGTLTLRPWTIREYQSQGSIKPWDMWELPQRKLLEYKTQDHKTTSSTLCMMPYPNNKQDKNTNSIISEQEYHLTQPCPLEGEKKELSRNLTLY